MAKSITAFVKGILDLHKNASNYTPKEIEDKMNKIQESLMMKKGGWLQKARSSMEKRGTVGSFTEYCGGKVTNECIERGLKSKDPKIRRRAAFAKSVRSFKKQYGGVISDEKGDREYLSQIIYMALGGEFEKEGLTSDDMNQMSIDEAREIYNATNADNQESAYANKPYGEGEGGEKPPKGQKSKSNTNGKPKEYSSYSRNPEFTDIVTIGPSEYLPGWHGASEFKDTEIYGINKDRDKIYRIKLNDDLSMSKLYEKYKNSSDPFIKKYIPLFYNLYYDEYDGSKVDGSRLDSYTAAMLFERILKDKSNHKYFSFEPIEDIKYKDDPKAYFWYYVKDRTNSLNNDFQRHREIQKQLKEQFPDHDYPEYDPEGYRFIEGNVFLKGYDDGKSLQYYEDKAEKMKMIEFLNNIYDGYDYMGLKKPKLLKPVGKENNSKARGGEQLPQEQQGKPEISYEEFVQLAMMYPEYVQRLYSELQQAQSQNRQAQGEQNTANAEHEAQETPEEEATEEQALSAQRFGQVSEQQPEPAGEYLYGGSYREKYRWRM